MNHYLFECCGAVVLHRIVDLDRTHLHLLKRNVRLQIKGVEERKAQAPRYIERKVCGMKKEEIERREKGDLERKRGTSVKEWTYREMNTDSAGKVWAGDSLLCQLMLVLRLPFCARANALS